MAPGADLQPAAGRCRQAAGQAARDDGPGDQHRADPDSLKEFARAKVNLFLHVIGRRSDGYHLLDSLAVFPPVGDVLEAEPADTLSLEISGPFAEGLPAGADNLVLRAAGALATPGRGARLRLTKNLPVASGIGGGSADAAAALRLLSRLWNSKADLHALALHIGADVPVCLRSQPVRMGGIGEQLGLTPGLPRCGILLVNPGIPVPTSEVFRSRRGAFSAEADLPPGWPDAAHMAADLAALRNDLQAPAIELCPMIRTVLDSIAAAPTCLLARMSGSGATCFGLFPSPTAARTAAASLARPGWWSWGGALAEDMMANFDTNTLQTLSSRMEVAISTAKHPDTPVTIWIVVAGDDVFIRSVKGEKGRWYRDLAGGGMATLEVDGRRVDVQAIPAIDAVSVERASREYLSKYQESPYAEAMARQEVLPTTMRLEPR